MEAVLGTTEITVEDLDTKIIETLKNLIFTRVLKKFRKSNVGFDDFFSLWEEGLDEDVKKIILEYYAFIAGGVVVRVSAAELYRIFIK